MIGLVSEKRRLEVLKMFIVITLIFVVNSLYTMLLFSVSHFLCFRSVEGVQESHFAGT